MNPDLYEIDYAAIDAAYQKRIKEIKEIKEIEEIEEINRTRAPYKKFKVHQTYRFAPIRRPFVFMRHPKG
jgi:hypothetical protein